MTDKYKIKEKDLGIKELSEGGKKIKIKIRGGDVSCEKEAYKKDGAKTKVRLDVIEMEGDKETTDDSKKHLDVETTTECADIKRGTLSDSIELQEFTVGSTTYKLKEKVSTSIEGWNMTFWIGLGVLIAVLVGLAVWWFLASRKEDKEEEESL